MKKNLLLGGLLLATVGLGGCAAVPSSLGFALVNASNEPIAVTDVIPRKVGQACGFNLLGIVALGDISTEAAKRDGGIYRVATVDKEVFSVLGMVSRVCTTVTGE